MWIVTKKKESGVKRYHLSNKNDSKSGIIKGGFNEESNKSDNSRMNLAKSESALLKQIPLANEDDPGLLDFTHKEYETGAKQVLQQTFHDVFFFSFAILQTFMRKL